MKFGLFVALNAILLIRPEELFPAITGIRLYLIVISLCTLLTLPELMENLSPSSLRSQPISTCILLYFASTILSLCVLGRVSEALFDFGPEFAKVILYYFLLVSIVDSAGRFRAFVATLVPLIVVLSAIALSQLHGYTSFPNIVPAMQRETDSVSGEEFLIPRLVSSGIFNDPNDLCLILGLGIWCCIYCGSTSSYGLFGWIIWLVPIPLFAAAILETHSRGGLLGVIAGGAAYLCARFGGPKSLPIALVGGFATMSVVGGRQGGLQGGDTAHQRVMMWADGLRDIYTRPYYWPTGLGDGWFVSEYGLVAHNSFVQTYVEQGILGGGVFLAAFLYGAWMVPKLGRELTAPEWAFRARPFVFAVLVGYAAGCYSITRNLVLPTYLTLGLVSVVLNSAAPTLPEKFCVNRSWFARLLAIAIAGFLFIKFATQGLGIAGI